ncbi:MAG: hypothetical protein IJI09_01860 [Clostridia bacterium]|nr:hypothetical protein [Clostridia bacterium]
MDNENRKELLPTDPDRQIQLVVNHSGDDEDSIDLGNVFHNMKVRKRLFAWVLVLCLTVGIAAPLLLYQFSKPELTVSSVVMLRYEVPKAAYRSRLRDGRITLAEAEFEPVTDLTAPDGADLDLNQITSAYVLQTALDGMTLSKPISISSLRNGIQIRTVLTDDSQRTKEALAGLAEAKNAEAYNQLQEAEMKYQNRFVVSLTNGFKEDEEDRFVTELKDGELSLLLNRILTVYNDYLVRTYADITLPDDAISVIDAQELDVLDSLDQLRSGIDKLYDYCDEKTDTVKAYRSWKTGRSLEDWMETLQTFRNINVDYLYSMVSENAITRDKTTLVTGWKYLLREAQNQLDEVNARIEETKKLLAAYKNDEVIVSMQESDAAKSTKASTQYYNNLILQQTADYEKVAELKATIADYTDRITRMDEKTQTEVTEEVEAELARSIESAKALYEQISAHMEEVFESPLYKTYEDHSAAQGKLENFLVASMKKMIIGAVAGAVIACGIWFLAALLPEFSKGRKAEADGKEAAAK